MDKALESEGRLYNHDKTRGNKTLCICHGMLDIDAPLRGDFVVHKHDRVIRKLRKTL